ncbi:hypothetical protein [Ralstonia psammae]|uniref:hypothetical protein n=1 Tax=Ralstonia psammae TaxID=3058598 RepID=UPI00293057C4|nr:hypothetical protein [Ralstonia sp. LMG 19083]
MKSIEIFVADAQIESFSYREGRLAVLIRADSGIFEIIFGTVLGMKAIASEGQDLSHLAESKGGLTLFPHVRQRRSQPMGLESSALSQRGPMSRY